MSVYEAGEMLTLERGQLGEASSCNTYLDTRFLTASSILFEELFLLAKYAIGGYKHDICTQKIEE